MRTFHGCTMKCTIKYIAVVWKCMYTKTIHQNHFHLLTAVQHEGCWGKICIFSVLNHGCYKWCRSLYLHTVSNGLNWRLTDSCLCDVDSREIFFNIYWELCFFFALAGVWIGNKEPHPSDYPYKIYQNYFSPFCSKLFNLRRA